MIEGLRYGCFFWPLWLQAAFLHFSFQPYPISNKALKDTFAFHLPADSLLARCIEAFEKRDLNQATSFGIQAAEAFHRQKKYASEALAYSYLGEICKQLGTIDRTLAYSWQGIDYARKAAAICQQIHDTAGWVDALNVQGIIFRDIGQVHPYEKYYDSARSCYLKAMKLIQLSGKATKYIPKLYNNLSQIATEYDHNYAKALEYLSKAIAINEKNHNLISLSYNYGNVAYVYQQMGNLQKSIAYARKTVAAAQSLRMPDRLLNAYEQAYESFKAARQFDSALYYYELYNTINDSMANVEKTQQIADMQTKYQTLQKESTIQQLNIQNQAKTRQISLLAGTLLLMGLLLGTVIWQYLKTEKQKKLIALQSEQLKTMMKELHHRVKNNLQIVSSLLSLQGYKTSDEPTRQAFRESQQRVWAMSLIHQRLYQTDQLTTIHIQDYLSELAQSLIIAFGYDPDTFDLQVTSNCQWLDVEKALPLGLMANEILTNAFKYAFMDLPQPALHINFEEHKDHMHLTIRYSSQTWDKNRWLSNNQSFGHQLVATLCKQLRARQELDIQQHATTFSFSIPKSA
ncbi:tetratricopeptide repeat-containing sensor histidine kinase [Thermoflavifilum thermophilum]|uniref:histidine kinase n=1 Tax=Thermoflavifilum thermophilum TaxID=1393122 RepID=A0A1I7NDK6_9BACT|nr:histidine kinase dimerization/phosphoacceptor domain -containing protein [Thermoflavifilum thermophilum]SFV32740.1 Two-component sensor histidine kinase, contains HisKA and HATPase domains [Thermoflavifilum thermophilum]